MIGLEISSVFHRLSKSHGLASFNWRFQYYTVLVILHKTIFMKKKLHLFSQSFIHQKFVNACLSSNTEILKKKKNLPYNGGDRHLN